MKESGQNAHGGLRVERLLQAARNFSHTLLAPSAAEWEAQGGFPMGAFRDLCKPGFAGLLLPTELGGAELSSVEASAIVEELAHGDLTLAFSLVVQNTGTYSLWKHGTPSQRDEWLPDLISGRTLGCYALTESDAGSDLASVTTAAARNQDGWLVSGEKRLLSHAPDAGSFFVLANATQAESHAGNKQPTLFLVRRDDDGVYTGDRLSLLGTRALSVGAISLRGCLVSDGRVLGEVGAGLRIALETVTIARVYWGSLSVGLAQAALDVTLRHLRTRRQFGKPLIEQQAIRFQLSDLATEIEAARLLTRHAAGRLDESKPAIGEAAMAKRFSADMVVRVTSECLELFGGAGYVVPSDPERYFRQARLAQIADGTPNIMRLIVARELERSFFEPD